MTVTINVPAELHASIAECIAARDEGLARADSGDRTSWNKRLIDQAIDVFAATGEPFTANDVRALLPEDVTAGGQFGHRFYHAANNRGAIRFLGYVPSNKKNTHRHPIAMWVGRKS
jgi:hypothetical protein